MRLRTAQDFLSLPTFVGGAGPSADAPLNPQNVGAPARTTRRRCGGNSPQAAAGNGKDVRKKWDGTDGNRKHTGGKRIRTQAGTEQMLTGNGCGARFGLRGSAGDLQRRCNPVYEGALCFAGARRRGREAVRNTAEVRGNPSSSCREKRQARAKKRDGTCGKMERGKRGAGDAQEKTERNERKTRRVRTEKRRARGTDWFRGARRAGVILPARLFPAGSRTV